MTFAQTQLRQLKRRLNRRSIKHRESNGLTLSYIEGWYAIAEANRIFGFDGWDRETVASQCVWAKPIGAKYGAAYLTRVRITVRAGDQIVVREGSGTGEATAASPGLAHEFAAKAAETDGTKRALSTFGNRFGLSLYGTSADVATPNHNPRLDGGEFRARSAPGAAGVPAPALTAAANENCADGGTTDLPGIVSKAVALDKPTTPPWPDINPFEEAAARAAQRMDKSKLFRSEVQRLRDPGHLRYVAGLSCLVCGRNPVHAHHLRFAQPKALGRKVSDEFTVPLCNLHHRELHTCSNEEAWWEEKKLSPLPIAQELWATSRRHRSATALQTEFLRGRWQKPKIRASRKMREVEPPQLLTRMRWVNEG
jgi:Rad52/22 family double-strand break repair protein